MVQKGRKRVKKKLSVPEQQPKPQEVGAVACTVVLDGGEWREALRGPAASQKPC